LNVLSRSSRTFAEVLGLDLPLPRIIGAGGLPSAIGCVFSVEFPRAAPYFSHPVQPPKRAVFLDRDGTLNVDREYLSDPAQLEIIPGTAPALRRLMDAGFLLFIVTNQSGIGRGYYTLADMHAVNERLCAELTKNGVRFEKTYFAPEAPEQASRGRKPSPQFLFDARDEFGLDLAQSYMVGDKLIDLECGWNAGVKQSILVRTGYGAKVEKENPAAAARSFVADHITAAADWILNQGNSLFPRTDANEHASGARL
jgi:D-glycero-D-manno-heptose 1,7-bisphosphate phosphatase